MFSEDLSEVEEVISNINNAMNDVKNEKNKTYLNMVVSIGGTAISVFGAGVTKGDDQFEYASASFSEVLSFAANVGDIAKQNQILKKYQKCLEDANELKGKIEDEILKLKQKFNELKSKHYSI